MKFNYTFNFPTFFNYGSPTVQVTYGEIKLEKEKPQFETPMSYALLGMDNKTGEKNE